MAESPSFQRRLATILAIDVAGYSHQVEIDENRTLAAVAELNRLIDAVADQHGGRLFHTAGDGFMVEFPTVTGALEAADALRQQAGLQLRMGVHLGEVSITVGGDLLGHGVNVAARLQARAPLNGILVSGDAVRAERGDLSKRFTPAGRIRLDKMRETLAVFLFIPAGTSKQRGLLPRLPRAQRRWIAAGLAVFMLIGLGAAYVATTRHSERVTTSRSSLKVTALPFQVLGKSDVEVQRFAGGLQADIVTQLSQAQLSVVEPAEAASAAYGFTGTTERDGKDLVVRIRLDDMRQHVTVWSEAVRNAADKADTLQSEVAHLAAQVASDAATYDAAAKGDAETVGLAIKMSLYAVRNRDEDREAEWTNSKLLLAKLPNDPGVHANLAIVSAFLAARSSPERAAEMRKTAEDEAQAALRIDPVNSEALFARYLAYPEVGHWRVREAALLAGLKVVPQSSLLTNHYSNFLREVGRLNEAVDFGRQAAAGKPPSPNRDTTLLLALAATDKTGETAELATSIGGTWPKHAASWNGRFEAMLILQRWGDALALLKPDADQSNMDEAERSAWRLALASMKSRNTAQRYKAVAAFANLPPAGQLVVQPPHEIYAPAERIGMLAMLGGQDEAFAEANTYLRNDAYADSSFLFWPVLENFRRDQRFHALILRVGLVDYWRSTSEWPDFCSDKTLPYDCKAITP